MLLLCLFDYPDPTQVTKKLMPLFMTQILHRSQRSKTCVHVCRPSSATGTRSASRHAVLHASAAADPGTSNGHAAGTPSNAAMPAADEQQTAQHATIASQTGRIRVHCSVMLLYQQEYDVLPVQKLSAAQTLSGLRKADQYKNIA